MYLFAIKLSSYSDIIARIKVVRKFSIGAVFISGNDNSNPRLIRFDTTLISSVKGANNKIKVIKRVAFGFRNFKLFRLRCQGPS